MKIHQHDGPVRPEPRHEREELHLLLAPGVRMERAGLNGHRLFYLKNDPRALTLEQALKGGWCEIDD